VRAPEIEKDIAGVDAIVHLAFIVMPIRSESETDSINIGGTKNVFEAAARAGIKNIVYTSSVASYGAWPDNPIPIKEDFPRRPMPDFYYSRTKAIIENWLDTFEKDHPDIRIVRLRPCIFVGPKINNLMRDAYTRRIIPAFTDYDPPVQFAWDEDVAQAIHLGLKKNVRGAFNIAGDGMMTMREMAGELGKIVIPMPYKFSLAMAKLFWKLGLSKMLHAGWIECSRYPIIVDCTKAKTELGWKPTHTTIEALHHFMKSIET
jgi:UDP-glucose 4-epimerase